MIDRYMYLRTLSTPIGGRTTVERLVHVARDTKYTHRREDHCGEIGTCNVAKDTKYTHRREDHCGEIGTCS